MQEKRFSLAGFQVSLGVDRDRVEGLRRSPFYRKLVSARRQRRAAGSRTPQPRNTVAGARQLPTNPPSDPEAAEIWKKIADIGWYHTIDLPHGVATPGFIDNRPTVSLFGLPGDLVGKRCLDIGTYDGFWAFEMERRGASDIIGIDVDSPADHDISRPLRLKAEALARSGTAALEEDWNREMASAGMEWPGRGFRVAAEIIGSKAQRVGLDVYDLCPERLGTFDLVFISQLLLRMRDPQTVVENMISVTKPGGIAIIAEGYDTELEQLSRPVSEFVGLTNMGIWWAHSIKSMQRMMETAGFEHIEVVSRFPAENRAGRFAKVVLRGRAPEAFTGA
jgi:tRNA (mo5U34)-methyltransferase